MAEAEDRLLDLEQIKQLKARYCRLMDTKQWSAMRELFSDDVVIESARRYASVDEFIETRPLLDAAVTTHHAHMPEIVFLGPSRARGLWALADRIEFDGPAPEGISRGIESGGEIVRGFTGTGYYEEEYAKTPDGWRISHLRLTRISVSAIVGAPPPSFPIEAPSNGSNWLRG